MAWPFANVVAPTVDSGIAAVPLVSTLVPGVGAIDVVWLLGCMLANTGAVDVTVRVTDGAGASIVPDIDIAAHAVVLLPWSLMPVVGLKWFASAAGVNGKLWGYK